MSLYGNSGEIIIPDFIELFLLNSTLIAIDVIHLILILLTILSVMSYPSASFLTSTPLLLSERRIQLVDIHLPTISPYIQTILSLLYFCIPVTSNVYLFIFTHANIHPYT